jgi:hypothetical protein
VNEELQAYTLRHASADMKRRGEFMTNALQALTDIHLHSDGYYDYFSDKQGNLEYMYLLAIPFVMIISVTGGSSG